MRVVAGSGPVGTAVAHLLVERGEQVRLITRSGNGPDLPGLEKVRAGASDPSALTGLVEGADTLFSCGGPAYDRWPVDWPPLGASLIETAAATGAVLLTTGNLYAYGVPDGPMKEGDPERPNSVKGRVRAKLWADALAARQAGRIRTAEVRGSDYLGTGAVSFFTVGVLPGVLAGKRTAWGRTWHVPSPAPTADALTATVAAIRPNGR